MSISCEAQFSAVEDSISYLSMYMLRTSSAKQALFPEPNMQSRRIVTVARVIFGLFYLATGVAFFLNAFFGIGSPPDQPTAQATAFTLALTASHFIDPLLSLAYLAGGGALLRQRSAPLGILVLAPVVLVIFCFHLVLSGQWIWGTVNLVWLLALAWQYRSAFYPLWSYSGSSAHGHE
jgi:hypothetical protein